MALYLVRHGEADQQTAPDPQLSQTGEQQVTTVANWFAKQQLNLQRIFHSGKRRAQQTAEIIATTLHKPEIIGVIEGMHPNDPVVPMAHKIQSWPDSVMLVGHLPFMSRLASCLLIEDDNDEILKVQTATIICLEKQAGKWYLDWIVNPGLLT